MGHQRRHSREPRKTFRDIAAEVMDASRRRRSEEALGKVTGNQVQGDPPLQRPRTRAEVPAQDSGNN
jgi:hypothetical protein